MQFYFCCVFPIGHTIHVFAPFVSFLTEENPHAEPFQACRMRLLF